MNSGKSGGLKPFARHGIGNAGCDGKVFDVKSLIRVAFAANRARINVSKLLVTGHLFR